LSQEICGRCYEIFATLLCKRRLRFVPLPTLPIPGTTPRVQVDVILVVPLVLVWKHSRDLCDSLFLLGYLGVLGWRAQHMTLLCATVFLEHAATTRCAPVCPCLPHGLHGVPWSLLHVATTLCAPLPCGAHSIVCPSLPRVAMAHNVVATTLSFVVP
jgi:hypothetical protein